MREIKFRGQFVYANTDGSFPWVYGDLVHMNPKIGKHRIITDNGVDYEVLAGSVGQFTGLHDKNDKEIYEGDFLDVTVFDCFYRDRQYRVLVEWVGTQFIGITNDDDAWNLGWLCSQDEEIEVIGNVHDNPELLKGGNVMNETSKCKDCEVNKHE